MESQKRTRGNKVSLKYVPVTMQFPSLVRIFCKNSLHINIKIIVTRSKNFNQVRHPQYILNIEVLYQIYQTVIRKHVVYDYELRIFDFKIIK